ncbi:unnamed protein product [Medioppia subpectinata]|uniref:Kinase-like protein n=1 Tax=Medioppia subpectinata TaxID=1979941 RepID=A0A7R9KFG2_9ACAR|nr:unnamed protein product [Medioppia subpectinata]CAG2102344.1 unnamed protein product [Medioppia subpectinata]
MHKLKFLLKVVTAAVPEFPITDLIQTPLQICPSFFKCNEENCGKRFNNKVNLIDHKRIHSGEKPFTPPHSDSDFVTVSSLALALTPSGSSVYISSLTPSAVSDATSASIPSLSSEGEGVAEVLLTASTSTILPMQVLERTFERAPADYRTPLLDKSSSSGALRLSSGSGRMHVPSVGHMWKRLRTGRLALTDAERLRQKTKRNVRHALRDWGFDVKYKTTKKLGQGCWGIVYRGVYNENISKLSEKQGRYMLGAAPGVHGRRRNGRPTVERHREGVNENIVAFRASVHLGRRVVLRNVWEGVDGARDIISYYRMFLIMDYGDEGSLYSFMIYKRLNDRLCIEFIRQLCSGLVYMHGQGIAHCDVHAGNVLLFDRNLPGNARRTTTWYDGSDAAVGEDTVGDYVVKWTDFGYAVSRNHFAGWGVDISAPDWRREIREDELAFGVLLHIMVDTAETFGAGNEGLDLAFMRALADDLRQTGQPLADVLTQYPFEKNTRLPINSTVLAKFSNNWEEVNMQKLVYF